jgi:hypothetical protein
MTKNKKNSFSFWEILLSFAVIYLIISLFREDSGKIVSDNGALVLDDKDMMDKVSKKLEQAKKSHSGSDHISISLD